MIRAFLFDFDGLLADTEPLHLAGFRAAAEPHGITLSDEDYYTHFVGFDDRDGFRELWRRAGREAPEGAELNALIETKARAVAAAFASDLRPRPGAVAFATAATEYFAAGVCSGALRQEVADGLRSLGLTERLPDVVAAEDVAHSKPDPAGYVRLIGLLSAAVEARGEPPLQPHHCLALEDTRHGLQSARAAGVYTVAVLGTEAADLLSPWADRVLNGLEGVDPQALARELLAGGPPATPPATPPA